MAGRIFRWGAIYGVIVLLLTLFNETRYGLDNPPPITHAEFYYGFTAVALVWQMAFWIIGGEPVRFRPLMVVASLEKFGWGLVAFGLAAIGRGVPASTLLFAGIDVLLGVGFLYAWQTTPAR